MKKLYITFLIIFSVTVSLRTMAQVEEQMFVDLIGEEPSVEINLGKAMLGLLSSATQNEEQGIASILSSLDAIKVTVFELEKFKKIKQIQSLRSEISKLARLKASKGFEKLASIKEDDSLVYVLARMDEKKLTNLNIYALDDEDELVIIDIKGNIHMSQIGDLMEHFNVDLDINGLELNKPKEKQQ